MMNVFNQCLEKGWKRDDRRSVVKYATQTTVSRAWKYRGGICYPQFLLRRKLVTKSYVKKFAVSLRCKCIRWTKNVDLSYKLVCIFTR